MCHKGALALNWWFLASTWTFFRFWYLLHRKSVGKSLTFVKSLIEKLLMPRIQEQNVQNMTQPIFAPHQKPLSTLFNFFFSSLLFKCCLLLGAFDVCACVNHIIDLPICCWHIMISLVVRWLVVRTCKFFFLLQIIIKCWCAAKISHSCSNSALVLQSPWVSGFTVKKIVFRCLPHLLLLPCMSLIFVSIYSISMNEWYSFHHHSFNPRLNSNLLICTRKRILSRKIKKHFFVLFEKLGVVCGGLKRAKRREKLINVTL